MHSYLESRMFSSRSRGDLEAQAPPAPVKTSQKKMATTAGRKYRESSGPPSDKFLDPLLMFHP